ncbi:glycosyltransferase [Aliarcobacter butzleri]|uniref:glycosyltransferase n=1 Tax=Aliarcobacter butzleri TaxID=28197 RepID=UPI00263EC235|nr:glycosyltransferase [Aliarcobacter butzleri]MDN5067882.1 glycosyltransferase [Aliarcobacter butzleri]MDN5072716.1 glycosyltransferase [Aliarcobacter butzleri]MDN5121694.1 glycosyltransferase [Aliarcobacter butzleri]
MKLLIYTENYFPGGLEKYVMDICKSSIFEVHLLVNKENDRLCDFAIKNDLKYSSVDLNSFKFSINNNNKIFRKFLNLFNFFADYVYLIPNYFILQKTLIQLSDYENILIVNGGYPAAMSSFVAAKVAKKVKFKNIFMSILSAPTPLYKNKMYRWIQSKFDTYFDQNIDFYLPNSNDIKLNLLNYTSLEVNKINVVYSGIKSTSDIIKNNFLNIGNFNLVKNKDTFWICMIGLLGSTKRQDLIIDAMKYLNNNVKLLVVGDGPKLDFLKDQVSKLNLYERVIFLGWVENPNTIYQFIDCLVFISDHEGLPYTISEAMSNKVPIIASSVGGISEQIINNRGGLLVSNNPREIADTVNELINNNKQTCSFVEFSYNRYLELFSVDSFVNEIKKLYEVKGD